VEFRAGTRAAPGTGERRWVLAPTRELQRGNVMTGTRVDCEQAFHRMYHYLDGELTVWRRWVITRHLARCPPCAQGFDFEVELRQVISSRCRDTVPPELKRRVADALGLPVEEER
jgi:mycothiol system anti-sigma-R factor